MTTPVECARESISFSLTRSLGSNSDGIERHELEKIFVEGDGAFVTYNCVAKSGKNFRNTEFFAFEGDRIKRIDVYFGATYENGVFVRKPLS